MSVFTTSRTIVVAVFFSLLPSFSVLGLVLLELAIVGIHIAICGSVRVTEVCVPKSRRKSLNASELETDNNVVLLFVILFIFFMVHELT